MKTSQTLAAAILAIAGMTLLAGCSVANKQETVGQYIDGTAITTEIKTKLAQDPYTSATSISVETMNAGVVQLSGFAKSEKEKNRAGELARSVKGVTAVHNNLIVRP